MIQKLGILFDRTARRWVPDPLVLAIFLTLVTFLMGITLTGHGPWQMMTYWYEGFWNLLTFAMQMCLILLTGYALANAPPIKKLLDALAALPRGPLGAVWLVALSAFVFSVINWGLGLIVGALMAREVGKISYQRKIPVPYPLLGAAGYVGLLVWHGGLSGSIPLLIATPGHFLEEQMGLVGTEQTLLSPLNLVLLGSLLVTILAVFYGLYPRKEYLEPRNFQKMLAEPETKAVRDPVPRSFGESLNESRLLAWAMGGMGLLATSYYFYQRGFELNLNIVNFTFLFLGLFLQGSVANYLKVAGQGAKACSGIMVQFPLYAGIMGMMGSSGMVQAMAGGILHWATASTYPLLAFFSAGLINLFVPSGGGQWAIQGPVMIEAAQQLGASVPKTALAVAYGESWTNMLQPFWALALLGITRLKAGEIIGYTSVLMLFSGILMAGIFLFFPG